MSKFKAQSRTWVFTWNNYTDGTLSEMETLLGGKASYIMYSKEVAPSTGTPHLQGYFETESKPRFTAVKKWYTEWHVEPAKGNFLANQKYIGKESPIVEYGKKMSETTGDSCKKAGEEEKKRWLDIHKSVKTGDRERLETEYPGELLRYNLAKYLQFPYPEKVGGPNYWLYGPPRTGKTTASRMFAKLTGKRLYQKMANKWWDGYTGEEIVCVDEVDKSNDDMLTMFKKMGDYYPFPVEVKGGMMTVRPEVVFITSNSVPFPGLTCPKNESPDYIWPTLASNHRDALKARYIFLCLENKVSEEQLIAEGLTAPSKVDEPAEFTAFLDSRIDSAGERRRRSITPAPLSGGEPSSKRRKEEEKSDKDELKDSDYEKEGDE